MVRKAAHFTTGDPEEHNLPPGLEAPPGLPAPSSAARKSLELALPPGLAPPGLETIAEDADSESTAADESSPPSSVGATESNLDSEGPQVRVTGLPNEILSNLMFSAALQQAGCKGLYASFTTVLGAKFGEALIKMVDESSAQWIAHHFHGRCWAADGRLVEAHVLSKSKAEPEADIPCTAEANDASEGSEEAWLEAWFQEAAQKDMSAFVEAEFAFFQAQNFGYGLWGEVERRLSEELCADVSTLQPSCAGASSGRLSAEAPEFTPGKQSIVLDQKCTNTSDVSTVDGESESDEDKIVIEAPCDAMKMFIEAAVR
jgi:hypothetical protein